MKKLLTIAAMLLAMCSVSAQTYTNNYPKELQKLAAKWVKKGEWKKQIPDEWWRT